MSPSLTPARARALRDWQRALGREHVVTDLSARRSAERATFLTRQTIPAILRPGRSKEVAACLEIADRHGVPLHPVSCGKNWGYGSRVPVRDGCVVLDLSRLNRIADFDEELGYVTLEPGVTFRQLHRFLRRRRSRLHANPTGSTPDSSPLANALERGIGQGPLGDRFASVCGLEVVLPNGDCVRTGFARLPAAAAAPIHRWGVGPWFDGLFSQSNLGVVTKLTLWLSPISEHGDVVSATIGSTRDLGRAIDSLRPLLLSGALRNPVKLTNDYRALSQATRYPRSITKSDRLLPRSTVRALQRRPFAWWLSSTLDYATPGHREPERRLLRAALGEACATLSFTAERTMRANGVDAWTDLHRPDHGRDVASTYWRKRSAPPRRMDPDRDGCGAIWCSPVVPLTGRHVANAVRVIERTTTAAGFEPMITITALDGRAAHLVVPLFYDRAVARDDRRALDCARRLLTRLARRGYYPYRLGVNSMGWLRKGRGDDLAFRRCLKRALDPRQILSPGRYAT
jgi:4-cresol dehydrogenase (hydroxylating)